MECSTGSAWWADGPRLLSESSITGGVICAGLIKCLLAETIRNCCTHAQAERFRKFRIRTYSTVAMIGGFIFIIWMGHVPLMALIFTIQASS